MRQVLLDTNVLLSFLTDRDPRQQEQAAELFRQASVGDQILLLHQAALTEMVFVLLNVYRISSKETAQILDELLDMPGTQTLDGLSWPLILDFWPDQIPDFGDAVLAAVARQGHYEVATFDSKLAKRLARQKISTAW